VIVVDANSSDVDALGEVFDPDVRAPEADVCGEIVEPQRLLGVLAHLLRLRAEVLGEVAVELVEVVVLDVQRSLFVGVSLREAADFLAVVVTVELNEPLREGPDSRPEPLRNHFVATTYEPHVRSRGELDGGPFAFETRPR